MLVYLERLLLICLLSLLRFMHKLRIATMHKVSSLKIMKQYYTLLPCLLLLAATSLANNVVVAQNNNKLVAGGIGPQHTNIIDNTRRFNLSRRTSHQQKLRTDQQQRTLQQTQTLEFESTSSSSSSVCKSIIAVGGTRKISESDVQLQHDHRTLQEEGGTIDEEDGSYTIEHSYQTIESTNYETDEEFVCELSDGNTLPLQGTLEQLDEMRGLLNAGELISAESTVLVDSIGSSSTTDEGYGDGIIAGISSGGESSGSSSTFATLPSGSIQLINNNRKLQSSSRRHRQLNRYEGTKKALIIRVTDKSGRQPDGSASYLSDKFFGTNGDMVTMASGFNDCTFGKLQFTYQYNNVNIDAQLSAPGVLEVTIDKDLNKINQSQMREAVLSAAIKKLGMSLPGPFDHVLIVVEKCYPNSQDTCSFAAYAFVNSWLSVYVEDNYKFPAVVMHELGHNLNLAHSGGLNGRTYTDHTCLMGNPLWEDNVGAMCFNPVKNYQVAVAHDGWYDPRYITIFNSGTSIRKTWSGRIIGVAQYDNNPSDYPFIIKLETGKGSDWFLGFNRAIGPNKDSQEANNQVTIYKVEGGNGMSYSHSFLKGYLSAGKNARITNWRDSGNNLVITVNSINLGASPSYADIEIVYEGSPVPTPPPTKNPTSNPTQNPTSKPTSSPTEEPTPSPTNAPTNKPTSKPITDQPTSNPTQLPGDEDVPVTDAPTPAIVTTSSPSTSGVPGGEDVPVTDAPTKSTTESPTPVPTNEPTTNQPTNKPTNVKDETILINFDDVTTSGYKSISNGYKGLNWNEFSVINKDYYTESGYAWGTVSGQYMAFYTGGSDSKFGTITSSGSSFAVSGFSATAAWETGVTVHVEGFDSSGNLIDSYEEMLDSPRSGATYIDLSGGNFEGLSELKISSSGGSSVNLRGEGPWLGIDDLYVTL